MSLSCSQVWLSEGGATSHSYSPSPRPAPKRAHSSTLRQPSEWTAGLCSWGLPPAGRPLENQGWWSPVVSGQWPGCHRRPPRCTETGGVEAHLPQRTGLGPAWGDPERLAGNAPEHAPPTSTPIPQRVTHSMDGGPGWLEAPTQSGWGRRAAGGSAVPAGARACAPASRTGLYFGATAGFSGQLLSSTCRGHSPGGHRPGSAESQPPGELLLS